MCSNLIMRATSWNIVGHTHCNELVCVHAIRLGGELLDIFIVRSWFVYILSPTSWNIVGHIHRHKLVCKQADSNLPAPEKPSRPPKRKIVLVKSKKFGTTIPILDITIFFTQKTRIDISTEDFEAAGSSGISRRDSISTKRAVSLSPDRCLARVQHFEHLTPENDVNMSGADSNIQTRSAKRKQEDLSESYTILATFVFFGFLKKI